MSELEHWVEAHAAYDRRDDDPAKNYGINGVELRWVARGDRGAVHFLMGTGWNLPDVQEELDGKRDERFPHLFCHPRGYDLGFHSPTAAGELAYLDAKRDCDLLPSGQCFGDGSALAGDSVLKALIEGGSDAVWKLLDEYYDETFADQPLTLAEVQQ